ncbi:DNA-binding protein [Seiridium cupressi]
MLLPSALSCDSSHRPVTRLSMPLFSSPPASPPATAFSGINNIMTSCRALQSMLAPAPIITASGNDDDVPRRASQLPTPPLAHATIPSPMKLRLRTRKSDSNPEAVGRKKIVKRAAPPRGINKRRRPADDDTGRDDDIDSDLDIGAIESADEAESSGPRTPKRARLAPEAVPLGLERSDYHNLYHAKPESEESQGEEVEVEADGEQWSTEEDRILVELILEKLKLSKNDWQDCARSLGKDRSSIGRRWKSLMINGDVGLKSRSRRGKLHGTWR